MTPQHVVEKAVRNVRGASESVGAADFRLSTLDFRLWTFSMAWYKWRIWLGDWLRGRAPPSHGGGHWFKSSIAHQPFSGIPKDFSPHKTLISAFPSFGFSCHSLVLTPPNSGQTLGRAALVVLFFGQYPAKALTARTRNSRPAVVCRSLHAIAWSSPRAHSRLDCLWCAAYSALPGEPPRPVLAEARHLLLLQDAESLAGEGSVHSLLAKWRGP